MIVAAAAAQGAEPPGHELLVRHPSMRRVSALGLVAASAAPASPVLAVAPIEPNVHNYREEVVAETDPDSKQTTSQNPWDHSILVRVVFIAIVQALQMIGLWLSTSSWPTIYTGTFGYIATAANLDFVTVFGGSFELGMYIACGATLVSAIIAVAVFLLAARAHAGTEVVTALTRALEDVERAEARGRLWQRQASAMDQWALAGWVLFQLSFIPATRSVLVTLSCHSAISCRFDCFVDFAHLRLVVIAIATAVVLTVGVAAAVVAVISFSSDYDAVALDFPLLQGPAGWKQFILIHRSPFSALFGSYTFSMRYFAFILFVAQFIAVAAAVLRSYDSTAQSIGVVTMQCITALVVCVTTPHQFNVADYAMELKDVFLTGALALVSAYRMNPYDTSNTVGVVLIIVSVCVLCAQMVVLGRTLMTML